MNKARICPICHSRVVVAKVSKLDAETGWSLYKYEVRCKCGIKLSTPTTDGLDIFTVVETEEVVSIEEEQADKAKSAKDLSYIDLVNKYGYSCGGIISPIYIKEPEITNEFTIAAPLKNTTFYLTGFNDRQQGYDGN